MPSLFTGYSIVNSALQAFQTAIEVTGNNISNVNTPGYTREAAVMGEGFSTNGYGLGPYEVGGGVNVETIAQIRNSLLDQSMSSAQSGLGQYETMSGTLQGVQAAFPEPGPNGISAALSGFFNAFSGLASNPGSAGAKLAVQQAGQTLADRIRGTSAQLQQQETQTSTQITGTLDQIDQLTKEIASLNTQIASQSANNGSPNALIDGRNLDIQKLSTLIDVKTSSNKDGSVNVYSNGFNLVDQGGASAMPRNYSPGSLTFSNGTRSVNITGGTLAGLTQSLGKIQSYSTQLDTLANNLRTQVNAVYATGTNSAGKKGMQFFNDSKPQTGASTFDLSAAVKTDPNAIAAGTSGKAGDGGMALALSHLNTAAVAGLSSETFGAYYQNLVGTIGIDTRLAADSTSTQQALVQQVQGQQQAVSGVSVDQEMSNMLMYQQGYQSAAKALSVIDQTANSLIQMIQ